jgi:hypothetical protein
MPQMVPVQVVEVRRRWWSCPLPHRTSPKSLARTLPPSTTTVFIMGWIGVGSDFRRAQGWWGDGVAQLRVDSGGNFRASSWHGGSSVRGRGGGRRDGGGEKTRQWREKEAAPPTVHDRFPLFMLYFSVAGELRPRMGDLVGDFGRWRRFFSPPHFKYRWSIVGDRPYNCKKEKNPNSIGFCSFLPFWVIPSTPDAPASPFVSHLIGVDPTRRRRPAATSSVSVRHVPSAALRAPWAAGATAASSSALAAAAAAEP